MFRVAFAATVVGLAALPAWGQTIEPAEMPGLCVTITGEAGPSESWPCDKSPRQEIELPVGGPGPLRQAGKCLEPKGQGYYPQLFAVDCSGAPAQTWTVGENGDIRNGEDRCLSLLGQISRSGGMIFAAECPKEGDPHRWTPKPSDSEIYDQVYARIEAVSQPGLCLTWIQSGSFMGLAPCIDPPTPTWGEQVFSFDRYDPGQFRSMGGCLTGFSAFGSVRISDCYAEKSRTWMLRDGSMFANMSNGACIEPKREGERWVVRMARCMVLPEQRWRALPIPQPVQ